MEFENWHYHLIECFDRIVSKDKFEEQSLILTSEAVSYLSYFPLHSQKTFLPIFIVSIIKQV